MKLFNLANIKVVLASLGVALLLASCYDKEQKASSDSTTSWAGIEYAPQMYHAEAYEPMTQVVDKKAGLQHFPFEKVGGGVSDYDSTLKRGHGEWFNSNYYNPHKMNMRQPVKGTIARGASQYIYDIHVDSVAQWASLKSPVSGDEAIAEGKILYQRFCEHCHGENGDGKGTVGTKFGGVPNYHTKSKRKLKSGNIYNTITNGKGMMRAHKSLLDPEERWKIAEYIKAWQVEVAAQEQ